ncbi:hypothetical protein QO015_000920 [Kaistia geumhonensis]|uniref:Uncharacterized protein n=1 Tax=Kaistia geumhonensis TaxID=410839 RepID=A0ABU0M2X6_9HYPH|nr:hypothetical protein [Kaistia geumhonensis]
MTTICSVMDFDGWLGTMLAVMKRVEGQSPPLL